MSGLPKCQAPRGHVVNTRPMLCLRLIPNPRLGFWIAQNNIACRSIFIRTMRMKRPRLAATRATKHRQDAESRHDRDARDASAIKAPPVAAVHRTKVGAAVRPSTTAQQAMDSSKRLAILRLAGLRSAKAR